MKSYNQLNDLREFGIIALTGEACGLGMRVLCDLTQSGVDLIKEFMRVDPSAYAWNSGNENDPHIASIMLPVNHSFFEDLWIFACVKAGYKYVFRGCYVHSDQWITNNFTDLDGVNHEFKYPRDDVTRTAFATNDNELIERYTSEPINTLFYISRWYHKSTHPGNGLDNEHTMSGRVL